MEIEQVDSYNLMAIAVLEFFGNGEPSEEEISRVENLLRRSSLPLDSRANAPKRVISINIYEGNYES
jgi:hypothetical protein